MSSVKRKITKIVAVVIGIFAVLNLFWLLEEEPETLSIKTTSGSIDLALPEDASFTLDYDSTSGDLSSNLPHRTENGQYLFGDGKAEYQIGTASGDVRITAAK